MKAVKTAIEAAVFSMSMSPSLRAVSLARAGYRKEGGPAPTKEAANA